MIPTSYLFKDIYCEHWGDPANPNPVDVPEEHDEPRGGLMNRIAQFLRRHHRHQAHAWSFTIEGRQDPSWRN